jgi:hypothetical protein
MLKALMAAAKDYIPHKSLFSHFAAFVRCMLYFDPHVYEITTQMIG